VAGTFRFVRRGGPAGAAGAVVVGVVVVGVVDGCGVC